MAQPVPEATSNGIEPPAVQGQRITELPSWWHEPLYVGVPEDKSRTLQAIGAGLPRTGTATLAKALRLLLDGPVCHAGTTCLRGPRSIMNGWTKAMNAPNTTPQDEMDGLIKDLTAGYVGITDAPGCYFVEELVRLYPDAIVICVTRDAEAWWRSYSQLLMTLNNPLRGVLRLMNPKEMPRNAYRWKVALAVRLHKLQPSKILWPMGPSFMEAHIEYVKRVVPPERLFFFDVKQGWGPLCEKLGVPVPEIPFPKRNERKVLKGRLGKEWRRALGNMTGRRTRRLGYSEKTEYLGYTEKAQTAA